jgi:tetratricopeptide (TPR) repeat protein
LTLINLGYSYRTSDQNQLAIEYLNRALSLYQALGDRPGEADTLIEIAYARKSLNEKQKALNLLARVRHLYVTLNDTDGEAYALDVTGVVYRDLGERQKALGYFNQALSLWRKVGNLSGEHMTRYHVARTERANGNLLTALPHIEAVLNHIEAQRGKINSLDLRTSYFAAQRELYEFDISLLMQLHKQQPLAGHHESALQASERAAVDKGIRGAPDPSVVSKAAKGILTLIGLGNTGTKRTSAKNNGSQRLAP